jgi:hypothetical protein
MGAAGALHIADMLKVNNTITSIDLRGNDMGSTGINLLLNLLQDESKLIKIIVSDFEGIQHKFNAIYETNKNIQKTLKANFITTLLCKKECKVNPKTDSQKSFAHFPKWVILSIFARLPSNQNETMKPHEVESYFKKNNPTRQ